MYLILSIFCLSVRTRNSKTIAPINLIFFTQEVLFIYIRGSILL